MPMLESLVLSRFRRVPSKIPTAWSEQTGGEPYCVNQEVRRLYPVRPPGNFTRWASCEGAWSGWRVPRR